MRRQRHAMTPLATLSVAAALQLSSALPVQAAGLEEVMVTARKRPENLQAVPAAVTALSATELRERQIDNISELQKVVANVTLGETSGLAAGSLVAFIRGVGNDPGFDAGVGIYLDDVYLQRQTGALLEVYDIERIEILKGPQGNLYGRNTTGGALKYTSREPGDTPAGIVEARIGSDRGRALKGSLSGPLLAERLAGGVGFAYKKRDGIQTNIYDGRHYGSIDTLGARANLRFTPADTLTIKLVADYSRDDSAPRLPKRVAVDAAALQTAYALAIATGMLPPTVAPSATGTVAGVDKVSSSFVFDDYRLLTKTAALSVRWDLNARWSLQSISAERLMNSRLAADLGGFGAQQYTDNSIHFDSDDITQEFQFNYGGDRTQAIVGLFYLNGRSNTPSIGNVYPRLTGTVRQTSTIKKLVNAVESASVYGNVDYDLGSAWHISVGGRFTREQITNKKTAAYAGTAYVPELGFIVPIAGRNDSPSSSATWKDFSPALKLGYDLSRDVLVYISYAEAFKAGGYNAVNRGTAELYDPERVTTYAAGFKSLLAERRLRINGEMFLNDNLDKQLSTRIVAGSQLLNVIANVGRVKSSGMDLDVSWLTPLDGLLLDVNLGYLDSEVKKYRDASVASGDRAAFTVLGFAPRWSAGLRIAYTVPLAAAGSLTLSADAAYRTESYTSSPIDRRSPLSRAQLQEEHTIYNAGIVFNTADQHWRFAIEGKNLSDKRVVSNAFTLASFAQAGYNDPRSWALSAAYSF